MDFWLARSRKTCGLFFAFVFGRWRVRRSRCGSAQTCRNWHAILDSIEERRLYAHLNLFQPQGSITMSNRDIYIEKMKLQLDELNASMNELEARTKEAKEDAREKCNAEMGKLRTQSKLALDKLEEMKAAGEDSWQNLIAGTEKVRDAFIHSFHYFKSQV
jgi:hypothetical protein